VRVYVHLTRMCVCVCTCARVRLTRLDRDRKCWTSSCNVILKKGGVLDVTSTRPCFRQK